MFRLGNAVYHGEWKNRQHVFESFFPKWKDNNNVEDMRTFPEHSQILFASYEAGGYDGDAVLLFVRDGQLYLVTGSHCSCYGLEECYAPEPTSWIELWQSQPLREDHGIQANEAWIALVGHNVTSAVEIVGEEEDGTLTVTRKLSGSGKQFMLVPVEFIRQQQLEEG